MTDILITRKHGMTLKQAKAAAQEVADELAEQYEVESEWQGNTLNFRRTGIDGHLKVNARQMIIEVKLGFLLAAFKSTFEQNINKRLDKLFDQCGRLS
jgi:putative polyhydroxyalkanoate system protein